MPKIGLKLWSKKLGYIPAARDLFNQRVFDYIELFTEPGSIKTIPQWKKLDIPYVLHAPHSAAGLNPADANRRNENLELARQVNGFFNSLSASLVIFHSGANGDLEEAISQFRTFRSHFPAMYQKAVIENKPRIGLGDERCLGASCLEIAKLCQGTGFGFCLDFTHAICYAQADNLDWEKVTKDFLRLSPLIYHVCDGHYSAKEQHKHLGDGELDLFKIVKMLPADCLVTLETPKNSQNDLEDFIKDAEFFRDILSKSMLGPSLDDKTCKIPGKKCLH